MNDFSVHRIIGRGGFGEVYGCRKADTGKMYAMKCLDKKRIKMKQGETLALNERIMLSLVSTGQVKPFTFIRRQKYFIKISIGLSVHRVHDVRFPHAGQALLHPGPNERRRPALPPQPAWGLRRARNAVLCCRGKWRCRLHRASLRLIVYGFLGDLRPRTHAQKVHRVQGLETRQYPVGRARTRADLRLGTRL